MIMMKSVNRITILNIISTFMLQGIAFITTPIFSRLLGTTQFGIYSVFNSWVLILTCLMGCGFSSAIGIGLYTYKEDYYSFRSSILLVSTVISILEIIVVVVLSPWITKLLGFSITLVVLIGVTAFAHYVVNFAQVSFTYEKRAGSNLFLSVALSLFSVLLSIFWIYRVDYDKRYFARIYAVAIIYLLTAIIAWLILFLKKPTGIKKEYVKFGMSVGAPIVFHSLSQQILGQSDRVMMQTLGITTAEIGIYSLFYTLSSVLSTILGALNNSWCPFYYDDVSEEKWDKLDRKCRNYIELFTVLGMGFILLAREVSYLMADEGYHTGINIIPILAIAVYFTFMYQFPVNFEFYFKKTRIIAVGTIAAGGVNIILNFIMIPKWGMYGAALATALSYLGLFIVHWMIVTHMKEKAYHLKLSVFIPGIFGMITSVILFYAFSHMWYVRWGIGGLIGCYELYRIFKRKSIF